LIRELCGPVVGRDLESRPVGTPRPAACA